MRLIWSTFDMEDDTVVEIWLSNDSVSGIKNYSKIYDWLSRVDVCRFLVEI